jgi:hypothetical protein
VGGLQGLASALAIPERYDAVSANASALQSGAARLLLFVLLGGGALWAAAAGRIKGAVAVGGVVALMSLDLWSINRIFYEFSPRADVLFANDAVTSYLQKAPMPYRVIDAGSSYLGKSILMKYRVPDALGYHGFSLRKYDELAGKDAGFQNILSPNGMDLLAIRYVILGQAQNIPGFHQVVGPTQTPFGTTAVLYERDTVPPYARVLLAAAKVPDAQVVATLMDPRFPVSGALLLPDSSSATVPPATPPFPSATTRATVSAWAPGSMTIALSGAEATASHLLVSENWYPDWKATVDGKPGVVRRGDHSLMSVDLPVGAREVKLVFDSDTYAKGKMVSLAALMVAVAMLLVPFMMTRKTGPVVSR